MSISRLALLVRNDSHSPMLLNFKYFLKASALAPAVLLPSCTDRNGTVGHLLQRSPAVQESSSDESEKLRAYYAGIENRLVAKGFMRTDDGSSEPPLDAEDLARNFERHAFYDEHEFKNGRFVPSLVKSVLRRWNRPVRSKIVFGPSVTQAQRKTDRDSIKEFAARLSGLTGVRINFSDRDPNFLILVLNSAERGRFANQLRVLMPDIPSNVARSFLYSDRQRLCSVLTLYNRQKGDIQNTVVLIKAEHSNLLRLGCIHEEMAQGLGLVNDSNNARPSIFNDDEEFALLTVHDELMLKILYDPRLKSGMTADEARPIVEAIAKELAS